LKKSRTPPENKENFDTTFITGKHIFYVSHKQFYEKEILKRRPAGGQYQEIPGTWSVVVAAIPVFTSQFEKRHYLNIFPYPGN